MSLFASNVKLGVEIDTLWNVKADVITSSYNDATRRNRYIVECKEFGDVHEKRPNLVEIDTLWNVKAEGAYGRY